MGLSTEIKVGLLMIASALLVVLASITVTGWNPELSETYRVNVVFDNVAGLQEGSPVRVAGIKVGTVDQIQLEGNQARAHLRIFSPYALHEDAQAAIKSVGILGDKFVELRVGTPARPQLADGDEIQRILTGGDLDSMVENFSVALKDVQSVTGAMSRSFGGDEGEERFNRILNNIEELTRHVNDISRVTNGRIDSITQQLDHFTRDLADITRDNKRGIGEIVENMRAFSENLEGITVENRDELRALVADLRTFTHALSEDGPHITADLRGILAENRDALRSSVANLDRSLAKLDGSMTHLESVSAKVDSGQGTIGKLVNDDQTVEGLNKALDNLNGLLGGVDRVKLDIGVHAEVLSKTQGVVQEDGRTKGYLTVQLQPLKDRRYVLQLVSNPRGKRVKKVETTLTSVDGGAPVEERESVTEVTEELQISAQIVQRYYDTEFKIGLYENEFGVGVEQIFGREEQFRLGLDGWDFGGEFGTHLKANASWRFHSNLFVVAGLDDFISDEEDFRDGYVGFGISFNEDVMKPFLGSLPLTELAR